MKQVASAVAAAVMLTALTAWADDELAAVDKSAPMFRLPVYNAKQVGAPVVGLDRFVGPDATEKDVKIVLLSFMASYCGPCKKEMPYLQFLHDKYKDFGLRVMMVSIDTEPDGMAKIDELIATNKVTFPILKDRFNLVARRWLGSQSPLPSVFLVKPDGVVSMVHRGYNQEASELFAHEIEATLGIKPGAAAMPVAAVKPEVKTPADASASDSSTTSSKSTGKKRSRKSRASTASTSSP